MQSRLTAVMKRTGQAAGGRLRISRKKQLEEAEKRREFIQREPGFGEAALGASKSSMACRTRRRRLSREIAALEAGRIAPPSGAQPQKEPDANKPPSRRQPDRQERRPTGRPPPPKNSQPTAAEVGAAKQNGQQSGVNASMSTPIRISTSDLHTPDVDSYVEMQSYLRRDVGAGQRSAVDRSRHLCQLVLSGVCSMIGGLVGWAAARAVVRRQRDAKTSWLASMLMFPVVAAAIGLFLGAAEGIICRNLLRALRCGAVGLGVGFVGGLIVLIPTGMIFQLMAADRVSSVGQSAAR